jgi:hypothetical protein
MEASAILQRFMQKCPIPVMVRMLLERVLTVERLNACFAQASSKQYTRELLFSSVFELMSLVVLKTFSSVNAAYQARHEQIGVSLVSVYNKLNGLDIAVPTLLVRETAQDMAAIIARMKGECEPLLPGYRVKMVDGNSLAATDNRLEVLRHQRGGALPGKALVVYDPQLEMAVDVIPCEDGYTQERSLLERLRQNVQTLDVLIMDSLFCVRSHLLGLAAQGAYFICRYHHRMPYEALSAPRSAGATETGTLREQWIQVSSNEGKQAKCRCITLTLNKVSRDGDKEIIILTNLPKSAANAQRISELYRKRRNIETMFQQLENYLQSEIATLGYPQAALFGFCVALIAYNVLAVVKAALRGVHGEDTIRNEVSGFYLAWEISTTYEAMLKVIDQEDWTVFQTMTHKCFASILLQLAHTVQLDKYKKHRREPKKAASASSSPKGNHVSTAKLLLTAKLSP